MKMDHDSNKTPGDVALPSKLHVRRAWLRRVGAAGTLFFLAKGLLWILVPALLAWFGR